MHESAQKGPKRPFLSNVPKYPLARQKCTFLGRSPAQITLGEQIYLIIKIPARVVLRYRVVRNSVFCVYLRLVRLVRFGVLRTFALYAITRKRRGPPDQEVSFPVEPNHNVKL